MEYIKSQFGHPRGLVGSLAGVIMAWENRLGNEMKQQLATAGFKQVRLETKPLKPLVVSALGTK